jgi:hypothetical protein
VANTCARLVAELAVPVNSTKAETGAGRVWYSAGL